MVNVNRGFAGLSLHLSHIASSLPSAISNSWLWPFTVVRVSHKNIRMRRNSFIQKKMNYNKFQKKLIGDLTIRENEKVLIIVCSFSPPLLLTPPLHILNNDPTTFNDDFDLFSSTFLTFFFPLEDSTSLAKTFFYNNALKCQGMKNVTYWYN